ncbi:MAG: DUF433 domain-containing protein [Planctomycetota bacterium]|nr:DUF433 domain-containing protein [Planctomycetota bacterium]
MASTGTTHLRITKTPGVCGGVPAFAGTRFPVRSIAVYANGQEWGTLLAGRALQAAAPSGPMGPR